MLSATRELPVGARQQAHIFRIPFELRTELSVGCAGNARYSVHECRFYPEREWYRRGYIAFVS